MMIRNIVAAVGLVLFSLAAGCNCPCMDEKESAKPESQVTVEMASETAVN